MCLVETEPIMHFEEEQEMALSNEPDSAVLHVEKPVGALLTMKKPEDGVNSFTHKWSVLLLWFRARLGIAVDRFR